MGKKPVPLDQPPREVCFIGEYGLPCYDPRKPEGEQVYTLTFEAGRNYQAMNPVDYQAHQDWIQKNCWGPKPKSQ